MQKNIRWSVRAGFSVVTFSRPEVARSIGTLIGRDWHSVGEENRNIKKTGYEWISMDIDG